MSHWRHRSLWQGHAPIVVTGLLLVALAAQGCGGDEKQASGSTSSSSSSSGTGGSGGAGGAGGSGGSTGGELSVAPAANGAEFLTPFDATPDPAGKSIYFTGLSGAPNTLGEPAVFSVPSDKSAPSKALFVGAPLVAPFNIATSTDGNKLFITDTGAEDGTADAGRIFSMPTDGGTPAPLTAADAYRPRGLEIVSEDGKDIIYFAGNDASGQPGVYKVSADGSGAVSPVAQGKPFVDPSGITVSASGDVYACDTVQEDGLSSIVYVPKGDTAISFIPALRVGYPCGVALTADGKSLIVSSLNADTQTDALMLVDLATKATKSFTQGIDTFVEPGGLHRAKGGADVFAWVDSKAQKTGTVFTLKIQ